MLYYTQSLRKGGWHMDKAPRIQPSSAIRKDYKQFSDYCHESMDPVFVTNNGVSDLIVMSPEAYYRREAWNRLQIELAKADKQMAERNLYDHEEVFSRLRERLRHE